MELAKLSSNLCDYSIKSRDYGTKAITKLGTSKLLTNSGFGGLFWLSALLCTSGTWLLLNNSMSQSTVFITQQCFRALQNGKCALVMVQ